MVESCSSQFCLKFFFLSSVSSSTLNTYLGGKEVSKAQKWLCPLFSDHVPSIRRQAGSVARHAHQHTICHQGFAAVKAFPGAVPGHHLRLRFPRNVQTGTATNAILPWLSDVNWLCSYSCFSSTPFSRLSKNCGILPRPMPTCQNVPLHLSCSPSQSWFLMLRVSWCRWTDCQGAMRSGILVVFWVFDVLHKI